MNLENKNKVNKSRQNRLQNAFFDAENASALVYFLNDLYMDSSETSRRSHAPDQISSAPGMDRENSGFSM
ncbi:MAG TPA: hypothetical protein D7I07_04595 [Candidatus Poseidoniales archaeon]|nr:MAG TPA: hypothetical protein D7I07_04595 [Candidatus Poseidoniales archaeon]